jgi:prolipoprotein diacylglyceryl transferase
MWAIPFGLVGARLYHVATDPDNYFGAGGSLWQILYVWQGGLGVWGGIALGAVGAWIGCRRAKIRVWPALDAMAPGVILAQAIGRWGNWFNQELFGSPTDLPWGLEIDPENRPAGYAEFATFHPTFLYEFCWNLLIFALLIWFDRRRRTAGSPLGHGQVLALYVMGYTLGRGWIEMLRIDTVQLSDVAGLRFNVWTSIVLFVVAAGWFAYSRRRWPAVDEPVYADGRAASESVSPSETDEAQPGRL